MLSAQTIRRLAFTALAALVFAQGAIAAMGCATLRADAQGRDIAVMPSGEPCDMMGEAPAAVVLKHCAGDDSPVSLEAVVPTAVAVALYVTVAGDTCVASAPPDVALKRPLWPPPTILFARLRD